jgi:hypothetical protein
VWPAGNFTEIMDACAFASKACQFGCRHVNMNFLEIKSWAKAEMLALQLYLVSANDRRRHRHTSQELSIVKIDEMQRCGRKILRGEESAQEGGGVQE